MSPSLFSVRRRAAGRRAAPWGMLTIALLAACDIPTSAPIIAQRWIVPSQSLRIAVSNLLPAGVSILTDSSGFSLTASAASITRALSQDCAACLALNGQNAPKPAFTANASASSALPADVSSATLSGGTLLVAVVNNFTFDPLRPSALARGHAVITVFNGTTVIGRDSVNGAQVALAANGGVLTRSIALAGAVSSASPLTVSLVLNSPAGDNVQMDASRTLSVTATPTNLRVASANVAVANRSVTSSTTIDLADIDSTITNRVTGGGLLLSITNPFNVRGTLQVRLTTGATTVTKSVDLTSGSSARSVTFTQSELRSLLGRVVTLTFSGAVSSTSGTVNVSPKQAVVVTSRLDLSLEVGG